MDKAKVGPAVEAETAGRAGLAAGVLGGLFTLPDHAGKHRNPDSKGFFFLGSEVLPQPDLTEEEPSWKRTAQFPLMIRSRHPGTCSAR
jgi:hypothetical protein